MPDNQLRVGHTLYGYCGGEFGRSFYGPARVEAVGADWVVARTENNCVWLYEGRPEDLLKYTTEERDEG